MVHSSSIASLSTAIEDCNVGIVTNLTGKFLILVALLMGWRDIANGRRIYVFIVTAIWNAVAVPVERVMQPSKYCVVNVLQDRGITPNPWWFATPKSSNTIRQLLEIHNYSPHLRGQIWSTNWFLSKVRAGEHGRAAFRASLEAPLVLRSSEQYDRTLCLRP